MKKLLTLLMAALMLFTNVYAAVVEVNVDGTEVNSLKDGEINTILLEEAPYINESGRTMVPVSVIAEVFGATVSRDDEKREVSIANGEDNILLTVDKAAAIVNEEELPMDSAPEIKEGSIYVPLRFIGEVLGYNLNYVATTRQIVIDDTKIAFKLDDTILTMAEVEAFYDIYYQVSRDSALAKGATEENVKMSALYAALEVGMNYTAVKGAFPEYDLDEAGIADVKASIKQDEAYITTPLKSISALCHEKLYYSNGIPAVYGIAKSEEVKKICEDNYIRAKHILVDDEETANAVLAKVAAGYDFDELVAEYGKDPGMEVNKDGYVFTYGEMVKEFEDAAFALEAGSVSLPVKSDFGYHIIKREALGEIPESIPLMIASGIVDEKFAEAKAPEMLATEEELLAIIK